MIFISHNISILDNEIDLSAIRSQGSGGQNVNKVSTAIHLRFDINASSLPVFYTEKLLALSDSRINSKGIIVIKAQSHRSQEKNKEDAIARLQALIKSVSVVKKKRRPTKPSRSSQRKRLDKKTKHSNKKALRNKNFE